MTRTGGFFALILVLSSVAVATACTTSESVIRPVDRSQPPAECFARESVDAGLGQAEPIRCVGGGGDAGDADCPQGYRCNTALAVPACQRLYCGTPESLCSTAEICVQGAECFEGTCTICNVCGDQCAVDFANDPKNCGTCGNVVPKDRTCVAGVPTCSPPLIECNGTCVDSTEDPAHCGACDSPVPTNSVCEKGAPACAAGFLSCKGKCLDPTTDDANCTACNKRCEVNTTCTKLGGGGCIGRITTTTPSNVDCDFLCSLAHAPCVDGSALSFASYKGTATKRPATCSTDPPQSITEGGVEHAIVGLSCACLYAPQ